MPLPPYDEFVNEEANAIAAAYQEVHGMEPAPPDLYHNAWRRLVEGWTHANVIHAIKGEPLDPPEPEPGPTPSPTLRPIIGRLRAQGLRFVDDSGSRLVVHKHAFTMFWEWCQGREQCRQEFFLPIQTAGYQGVRVLTTVNEGGAVPWWEPFGVRLGPLSTPNFYQKFQSFCEELVDWGLQAHFVSGGSEGWDWDEYRAFHAQIGGIIGEVESVTGRDVCDFYEVQNEVLATGNLSAAQLVSLRDAARNARGQTGQPTNLYGLSGLGGMEDRPLTAEYTPTDQPVMLVHPLRDPMGDATRAYDLGRHYVSWLYDGEAEPVRPNCLCGEPGAYTRGTSGGVSGMKPLVNQDLVSEEASSLYTALQVLCRSIGTLMSDPGVTGPRFQGRFEDVPGFWTVPKLVQLLEDFAPEMHSWRLGHRGRDYMRVKLVQHDDRVRIDGMCEAVDGRSAVVAYGPAGSYTLDIGAPARVRVVHAKDDRTIEVEEWNGERYIPVTWTHGRLVLVG